MSAALALVLSLCSAEFPDGLQDAEDPTPGRSRFSLGAHARLSFPVSEMDRDIVIRGPQVLAMTGTFNWSDFFPVGIGGAFQADLLWEERATGPDPVEPESAWAIGGYVAIGFYSYGGRKVADTPDRFIDPDALNVLTILFGGKFVRGLGDRFFLDGHVGIGPVHYSNVDAEMRTTPTEAMHGEFISDSWAFGLEAGAHVGLRSGNLAFVLGIEFRLSGSPESGRDVAMNAKNLVSFGVDLGVDLRF